jgi:hypothetical protein
MTTSWYVVKYVPDVFRNEPRNVGVVVTREGRGEARFIAEDGGRIDGRRVQGAVSSVKAFKAWVEFLRYHLEAGTFESQLDKLSLRSRANYYVEKRGVLLDEVPDERLHELVENLFRDVVRDQRDKQPASLDELANRLLFKQLALPPGKKIEKGVRYRIDIRGVTRELNFDYRYDNGKTTILEKISLADKDPNIGARVNDLLYRIEHVMESKQVTNFVALYDMGAGTPEGRADQHLRAIERYSYTVNMRKHDAAEEVGEQLGVPALV